MAVLFLLGQNLKKKNQQISTTRVNQTMYICTFIEYYSAIFKKNKLLIQTTCKNLKNILLRKRI